MCTRTRYRNIISTALLVGIDYFPKAVNFGCILMHTKNHVEVIRGLQHLAIQLTGITISDGPLDLAKKKQELEATHICYVNRLAAPFGARSKGLNGSELKDFMDRVCVVVREDFPSEGKLD
eukprot:snap_masked-scaffold_6-processed-gene-14.27-mRNA-1 protein AED:1.00 eAED:1.00 QI:0/0/0/0/1/1/2/0/120